MPLCRLQRYEKRIIIMAFGWYDVIISVYAAFLIDCIFGDPQGFPHPVRLMGKLISLLEKLLLHKKNPWWVKRILGGLLVLIVLGLTGGITFGIVFASYYFEGKYLGTKYISIFVMSLLNATCIASRDLNDAAMKVCRPLLKGNVEEARQAVSMIVGRDTKSLDADGIARAAVETVAENTNDGVVAPVIFLLIGGPVGGMLYKAINTMDSMIGYKNHKYMYFGTAAAKLDDIAGFVPARISAILMVVAAWFLRYDSANAWRIFLRDRYKHASPNSAQCESVCAGALEVRLAGDAYYSGQLVKKEFIGDPIREISPGDIIRACKLMYFTVLLLLALLAMFTPIFLRGIKI